MKRGQNPAVFLFYFTSEKTWQKRPHYWGTVQGGCPVYGVALSSKDRYERLSLPEKQVFVQKKLLQAQKRGGSVAGIPPECRLLLQGKAPLAVPDGKPLAIVALLERLEQDLGDLKGKELSLEGVTGLWALGVTDYLAAAGAWLTLTGSGAGAVAKALLARRGIVVPIGRGAAPCRICLYPGETVQRQVYCLEDSLVSVSGDWQKPLPFPPGYLPASLGAAVALAGRSSSAFPLTKGRDVL